MPVKLVGKFLLTALLATIVAALIAARGAGAATSFKHNAVTITASFSSYPECVNAGETVPFPLTVTNTGHRTQEIIVDLTYVTHASDADPLGTVIADGTDHLLGLFGAEYWRFKLKPGQAVTKTLVGLIPSPRDAKKGPARYGLTELVYASGYPSLEIPVSVAPAYCQ